MWYNFVLCSVLCSRHTSFQGTTSAHTKQCYHPPPSRQWSLAMTSVSLMAGSPAGEVGTSSADVASVDCGSHVRCLSFLEPSLQVPSDVPHVRPPVASLRLGRSSPSSQSGCSLQGRIRCAQQGREPGRSRVRLFRGFLFSTPQHHSQLSEPPPPAFLVLWLGSLAS